MAAPSSQPRMVSHNGKTTRERDDSRLPGSPDGGESVRELLGRWRPPISPANVTEHPVPAASASHRAWRYTRQDESTTDAKRSAAAVPPAHALPR